MTRREDGVRGTKGGKKLTLAFGANTGHQRQTQPGSEGMGLGHAETDGSRAARWEDER